MSSKRSAAYSIVNDDAIKWLSTQRAQSFHAVVTDPPFGLLEYSAKELKKRRNGNRGIWRLPQAFDGFHRQPKPRFTILTDHDRMGVLAFHLRVAPELFRVLVPGAHVIIASQCLVSHLVAQAFAMAGFEARGQIVRIVKTFRGGDRPKFGDKLYREVSVIPFPDLLEVPPPRASERSLANHPSLKPQTLMRALVRAALPLGRGVILDPFMGSGSTIAAATHLGLRSVGIEIDVEYFRLARGAIGKLAILATNGDAQHRGRGKARPTAKR